MIPEGYAVVTPARNERVGLERLARALVAQTLEPRAWIIVDDGSVDGTAELAAELQEAHPWIHAIGTQRPMGAPAAGRREGRALDAFRDGVRALDGPVEVVVKVDADTSFDPHYLPAIVARFRAEPDLGIAGGACYELEHGRWVRQKVVASHPRGASRAYRWDCLQDVMSLESRMGWDGLDEVKARLRGYRSQTLLDLAFRHHRPTGARERSRLRHQTAQGRAASYMGYRPSYLVLRSLYRLTRDPSAAAMVWGYVCAAVTRSGRCPDADVVRAVRADQRLRAVLRRGAPP